WDSPRLTKRSSSSECSGSGIVRASGSPKTVIASSNDTPCFLRFCLALLSSHSKARLMGSPDERRQLLHGYLSRLLEFTSVACRTPDRRADCRRMNSRQSFICCGFGLAHCSPCSQAWVFRCTSSRRLPVHPGHQASDREVLV